MSETPQTSPTPTIDPPNPTREPAAINDHKSSLRREAMLVVPDRGRVGLLIALCSMAGVAVGFGLSSMAMGFGHHRCTTYISHSVIESPVAQARAADTPAWLGVCVGTDASGGAAVDSVVPGSPAAAAGLQRGDVIIGFTANGPARLADTVRSHHELVRMVQSYEPGALGTIILDRDGDQRTARVRLAPMPQRIFEAGPYCPSRR